MTREFTNLVLSERYAFPALTIGQSIFLLAGREEHLVRDVKATLINQEEVQLGGISQSHPGSLTMASVVEVYNAVVGQHLRLISVGDWVKLACDYEEVICLLCYTPSIPLPFSVQLRPVFKSLS